MELPKNSTYILYKLAPKPIRPVRTSALEFLSFQGKFGKVLGDVRQLLHALHRCRHQLRQQPGVHLHRRPRHQLPRLRQEGRLPHRHQRHQYGRHQSRRLILHLPGQVLRRPGNHAGRTRPPDEGEPAGGEREQQAPGVGAPASLPPPVPDRGQHDLRPLQRRHRHALRLLPRGHEREQRRGRPLLQLQEPHRADEGTGGGRSRCQQLHC